MKKVIVVYTAGFALLFSAPSQSFGATAAQDLFAIAKEMGRLCYQNGQLRESHRKELESLSKSRLLKKNSYDRAEELESKIAGLDRVCHDNLQ